MKPYFRVVLIFCCLGLSSCATQISGTDSGPNAPKSDKPGFGVVAYNPDGMTALVESRRGNALSRIVDVCGSNEYKITKEETREPKEGESEDFATFGASRLTYLSFQCNKPRK